MDSKLLEANLNLYIHISTRTGEFVQYIFITRASVPGYYSLQSQLFDSSKIPFEFIEASDPQRIPLVWEKLFYYKKPTYLKYRLKDSSEYRKLKAQQEKKG